MKHSFLAIDLGATSGRIVLGTTTPYGFELEELFRFPNHIIEVGGHLYWDIYELYRHIIKGMKKVALRDEIVITSIGIDTWGLDFVCVGKDGAFLRQPYSYRDPHLLGASKVYFSKYDKNKVYQLTGIQVMDINTLCQLDTLRRHNDSALAVADKILFLPDALNYMLTGKMVTEYTIATTAQLVNATTRQLEPQILETVGLTENNFARLVYPGETIGVLTEEVQRMTGLGPIPIIAVAEHDTASAVVAIPVSNSNFAYISSGTWSLMGIETNAPIIDKSIEQMNFTNEGGVGGTIRLLKNICGMWLLERCRSEWEDAAYSDLISEAKACEPFRSLVNPDDPIFTNPMDMEQAIKHYCAEHHECVPRTRGQIVRCIFESLVLRYRQVLGDLRNISPVPIEVLHIIGGGSRNELLNQWTADAINLPIIAGPMEATAIGNIIIQMIAAGVGKDIKSIRNMISNSVSLKTYYPNDVKLWDDAYSYFVQLT